MLANLIKQISFPTSVPDLTPGSVAVVTNYYTGIFGGPLSQLLKCLTAVKICAELEKNGASAVPVCLVRHDTPPGFSQDEINFIDRASKLHCLKSAEIEKGNTEAVISGEDIERLFKEIEKIFPNGDHETLSTLKEAFIPGADLVSSCVKWLKYLMKDFNAIILEYDIMSANQNPDAFKSQTRELSVAAVVVDLAEMAEYVKAPQERWDVPVTFVRPCPDVTISNARNMKTLRCYKLDFERLTGDKEHVIECVRKTLKSDVPDHLQKLRDETVTVLDELEPTAFAMPGKRSEIIRKARSARIIYQMDKILKHSREALENKEKAAENRVSKALEYFSPLGLRQQDTLGGAQVPLVYGQAGLRALYDRLDITTKNRQLIEMY